MKTDPRNLAARDLCILLNSTAAGEVINERKLRDQRTRAGMRIAAAKDEKKLDLYRYAAWAVGEWHDRADDAAAGLDGRSRALEREHRLSAAVRDIGDLPAVVKPERRDACGKSLRLFCETYGAASFNLAWSPDHLRVIDKIEVIIRSGGTMALAMPRGSGKTTIIEFATIWAILYGYRRYVVPIAATDPLADKMLDSIKSELTNNPLLMEDFPEVCQPIRRLEGISQRAKGQTYQGVPTNILWGTDAIRLATIPGSVSAGAVLNTKGITGSIRGMREKNADGSTMRPDLVLIDDPQTDQTARSAMQTLKREAVINGAIMGLAGPGKKIAGLMACTVIIPDDLSDRFLSHDRYPQWEGERTKMLVSEPKNIDLWKQYEVLQAKSYNEGRRGSDATEFYINNREEMDEGAEVSWPERHNEDEVSGIQHAMNLKIKDPVMFASEYQNEPLTLEGESKEIVSAEDILEKMNGMSDGEVPQECTHLTGFADIQGEAIYWMVMGWTESFSGSIVAYGTLPKQPVAYYENANLPRKLSDVFGDDLSLEARLFAGLRALEEHVLARVWRRYDGVEIDFDRFAIDANWGDSTNVVYQFCRESAFSHILAPSHGQGFRAINKPMSQIRPKPGERSGLEWRLVAGGERNQKHLLYNTNFWKSFSHQRLAVPRGGPGCVTIFGKDKVQKRAHQMLADHITAEYPVRTEAKGRIVDEWQVRPGKPDNHFFDCYVGCCVTASMVGCALDEYKDLHKPRKRRRIRASEVQNRKRR